MQQTPPTLFSENSRNQTNSSKEVYKLRFRFQLMLIFHYFFTVFLQPTISSKFLLDQENANRCFEALMVEFFRYQVFIVVRLN